MKWFFTQLPSLLSLALDRALFSRPFCFPFIWTIYLNLTLSFLDLVWYYMLIFYLQPHLLVNYRECYTIVKCELDWIDMCINAKKSCCIRIGPRYDFKCANITTKFGCQFVGQRNSLPWYLHCGRSTIYMLHYLCQTFFSSFLKRHLWKSWETSIWRSNSWASTEQMLTNDALRIGVLFFT